MKQADTDIYVQMQNMAQTDRALLLEFLGGQDDDLETVLATLRSHHRGYGRSAHGNH